MSRSALPAGVRHLRRILTAQRHRDDSDEQLLHAFLTSSEESAFAVLVRRHGPMVLHVCRRVLGHEQDAEDAFQATFLVLARNAARLRKKTALTSFLHGTAYRLALKAKQAALRRRKHEGQAPPRSPADPFEELSWREVRMLLDEEIARLPEKYRSVFVLCCLENVSREEAARRLGLKEGTLSSRLAEARRRLSDRLIRRGVELTAVLAAATLVMPPASALPAVLIAKTTQAALATSVGEGLASVVSAPVVALVQGATSALLLNKAKMAAALLLVASLLTGAGVWACRILTAPAVSSPAEPPAVTADDKPRAVSPKRAEAKTEEIQGHVLGPDGKPKAGAKLLLFDYKDKKITEVGVSTADGRFTVAVPKEARDRSLIAQADGSGIDFFDLRQAKSGEPIELRLVKDQAIRGRVVNTEGKPIRGVRVTVESINVYSSNSLDSFLIKWKEGDYGWPRGEKALWSEASALLRTTTDTEGRFALHGAGAERFVSLHLHGAGIADVVLWIVNREGFDPKPYNQARCQNVPKAWEIVPRWSLYSPDLSFVADAEKPIRGVVKDADSGKGRPNVVIYLTTMDEDSHLSVRVQTTTDAEGRYELHGAHKAKKYILEVEEDSSTGYMARQVWADDTTGYDPIAADIRVKKGVIVTGKVIDQATGQPVPGFAMTGVLVNNPFAKEYSRFNDSRLGRLNYTAENGVFRIVTIPGPVLLMGGLASGRVPGGLAELMKYKPVAPDPKYPQYFTKVPGFTTGYLNCVGGISPASVVEGNLCKVLHIKPGAAVVKQDIVLERASALKVKIRDAEGRPLTGVWATGIGSERHRSAIRIKKDSCSAYHLEAGKPRLMVFYHPEKKLAGSLMLRDDEKQPVAVKLGPAGSIKGRLLDADGKPLAGVVVEVGYRDREAAEVHQVIHKAKQVLTDAAGAFTLDELIPELTFFISSLRRGEALFEERSKRREPILHEVKPGERRDLGTLKMKPPLE